MLGGSALNRPALCEVYAESWLALRKAFQHCKYETMDQTGCILTAEFRNSCKLHPLRLSVHKHHSQDGLWL